jgi:hypothetical protein
MQIDIDFGMKIEAIEGSCNPDVVGPVKVGGRWIQNGKIGVRILHSGSGKTQCSFDAGVERYCCFGITV